MTKPKKGHHSDHDYQQGYEQGVWDTENRLADEMAEAQADRGEGEAAAVFALESIAAQIVTYFGDLATTLRELSDLRPREVDVLKRVTRDTPMAPHRICHWCDSRLSREGDCPECKDWAGDDL